MGQPNDSIHDTAVVPPVIQIWSLEQYRLSMRLSEVPIANFDLYCEIEWFQFGFESSFFIKKMFIDEVLRDEHKFKPKTYRKNHKNK